MSLLSEDLYMPIFWTYYNNENVTKINNIFIVKVNATELEEDGDWSNLLSIPNNRQAEGCVSTLHPLVDRLYIEPFGVWGRPLS